ncbi:glycosyltransferase family 2 protein [Parabacteroides sp. AM08-6]|uniref:glycosyltransferase family 2 protein n=1 Tax=Parabacteroides sp. AM08-6 TaxID=2292053 RepID=UPI000EFFCDFD|nr:glycosyltransferase family 2 protein [Parabacteroides sp. AM08-6]RHJ86637.1 glycosyltransferase [Parabacteroides sp. AM08-6]
MTPRIAVLIPCYNEEQTISKVIADYKSVLPEAEIIVYDNNSTDKTSEFAFLSGATVYKEDRQGKGNVIRSMFRLIEADCYIIVDGDDTYPAKNAREMVDLVINKHIDMVIGERLSSTYYKENKRLFHNAGNRLVCWLINTLFDSNVKDIMTGYRAFGRTFVKTFPVLSKGFEIETEMTIHALDKNFLLKEIPVEYKDRPKGSTSKLNTYKDGYKVLRTIFMLYKEYQPLAFFSWLSFFIFLLSLILFIPVLVDYIQTGLVPRFPTLIVSGIMFLCSLQCLFSGLILDIIVKKHRQLFELELNKTNRP